MATVKEIYVGESQVIALDYTNALPPGAASLEGADLEAHEWVDGQPGDDVSADFLDSETGGVSGLQIRFRFKAVTEAMLGKVFRVLSRTEFDDGQVKVDRVLFQVVPA